MIKPNSMPHCDVKQNGFSLIELMIAIAVLAVGMAALVPLFAVAVMSNGKAKTDTTATMLAQTVLEKVSAQPASAAPANITVTDCNPAGGTTFQIATAVGGSPLTGSDIDFTATPVANYNMQYVACGNNGRQALYDVRWNIQAIAGNGSRSRIITVAARPTGAGVAGNRNQLTMFAFPITLRTIGGQ
jgi:prepilin-type N-terminal cleavage/methylation domain-containing protein